MAEAARAFGLPARSGPVRDVEFRDQDGTMPAALSYSFDVAAAPAAVLDHFRSACRAQGLSSPPGAVELQREPDLLCAGPFDNRESIGVQVVPRCARGQCSVYVEISS